MTEQEKSIHTRAEILSQPEVWPAVLRDLRQSEPVRLPQLADYASVHFTGCGSTYYLSKWAALSAQIESGQRALATPASELWLAPSVWVPAEGPSLLVAISRSGKTSETLKAVEAAKAAGVDHVTAITCYPDSPLASSADSVLVTAAGQESSVVQTRSFTSMMLAAAYLLDPDGLAQAEAGLEKVGAEYFERSAERIEALAPRLLGDGFVFLGGGPRYALASELTLKMTEMSLSVAHVYHPLELRHGPMSMVGAGSTVILLSGGSHGEIERRVLADMASLGAALLEVTADPQAIFSAEEPGLALPDEVAKPWRDVLYLPPLHWLALKQTEKKGLDADQPENLQAVIELE